MSSISAVVRADIACFLEDDFIFLLIALSHFLVCACDLSRERLTLYFASISLNMTCLHGQCTISLSCSLLSHSPCQTASAVNLCTPSFSLLGGGSSVWEVQGHNENMLGLESCVHVVSRTVRVSQGICEELNVGWAVRLFLRSGKWLFQHTNKLETLVDAKIWNRTVHYFLVLSVLKWDQMFIERTRK